MRTLLVATLAFAPVLLHAQATSPAQQTGAAVELQSRLVAPKPFAAAAAAVPTSTRRISTGVVAPRLIATSPVVFTKDAIWNLSAGDRQLTVSMVVDAKGIPTELKIVNSPDALLNSDVLASVAQYRFTPGSVTGVPTAIPVNLAITVRHFGE
jgi:hypothetical protein